MKKNTWNIRCLVDESFVPANQRIILQIVGYLYYMYQKLCHIFKDWTIGPTFELWWIHRLYNGTIFSFYLQRSRWRSLQICQNLFLINLFDCVYFSYHVAHSNAGATQSCRQRSYWGCPWNLGVLLTLFQPEGADLPTTLLVAPPDQKT